MGWTPALTAIFASLVAFGSEKISTKALDSRETCQCGHSFSSRSYT